MATEMTLERSRVIDDILAIRERWHTKNHPFSRAFAEGRLPLRAMGVYLALHWQFVQRLASFVSTRSLRSRDVRKSSSRPGRGGRPEGHPREGRAADHNELIFRFCRAASL
jgi:pyrroloquinoline quinone (PQQ) biosynthesis protein C